MKPEDHPIAPPTYEQAMAAQHTTVGPIGFTFPHQSGNNTPYPQQLPYNPEYRINQPVGPGVTTGVPLCTANPRIPTVVTRTAPVQDIILVTAQPQNTCVRKCIRCFVMTTFVIVFFFILSKILGFSENSNRFKTSFPSS